MRLLDSHYGQDLDPIFIFGYLVESSVRPGNMQTINVFMPLASNLLFVALAREWVNAQGLAFLDHYSSAFLGQ